MSTSLPRPLLIALLGAVVLAGVFFVTRGKGGNESTPSSGTPPSSQTAPPTAGATQTGAGTPTAAPSHGTSSGAKSGSAGVKPGGGRATPRTLPVPVKRALDAHKVVLLLFWHRRGSDDRSVKHSVDRLSRRGGRVAVFTSSLKHLARYTPITAAAGVTQTPTIIVVDPRRKAEVATGYLDQASIEQMVVDALRIRAG